MIASAAVRIIDRRLGRMKKVLVIPCHRHCDVYDILSQLGFLRLVEYDVDEEGFLDEHGEFLSRVDAMKEAVRCGRMPEDSKGELFSEDLW